MFSIFLSVFFLKKNSLFFKMPQLDFLSYYSNVFWFLVIFFILFHVLYGFAFPNLFFSVIFRNLAMMRFRIVEDRFSVEAEERLNELKSTSLKFQGDLHQLINISSFTRKEYWNFLAGRNNSFGVPNVLNFELLSLGISSFRIIRKVLKHSFKRGLIAYVDFKVLILFSLFYCNTYKLSFDLCKIYEEVSFS